MTKNQKTFAYVGGGILLLLLLFRKKGMQKSLEEGGASEEGGIGGGGGGGIFGGGGGSVILPPVVTPIVPSGYVVVGQGGLLAPLSGLNPNNPTQAVVAISNVPTQRETPPTPTPSASSTTANASTQAIQNTKPPVASATSRFSDFDGDANFQDQLL
jgi:hypothetical protein